MKKSMILGLLALLLIAAMAGIASSTMIAVNDPFITQSWDQQFRVYNGGSSFDKLEVFSTGQLADPGVRSFSDLSWTSIYVYQGYEKAQGNNVSDLIFNIHFEGVMSTVEHFILATWSGDKLIEANDASWDGHGWSISNYDGNVCDLDHSTTVPEPGTIFLLGCGLAVFAIFGRRMKARA